VALDGRGYRAADRPHGNSAQAEPAPPAVPTLRAHYATCIRDEAQRSVESIIRIGELLSEAKGALETDEWLAMVETDIGLRRSAAYSLMKIATTPALRASNTVGQLPASWGTLATIARLDDDEIETAIEAGEITPTTTRAQASALVARSRPEPTKPILRRTRDRAAHEQIESALDTLAFHVTHIAKLVDAVDDTSRLRAIRAAISRIIAIAEARP